MLQELNVEEQFSPAWKMIAILSTVLAILFFIIFLVTEDPLWKGIFRLTAFIAFIGAVFSFLRLREGKKVLHLEFAGQQFIITYLYKSESVKEEFFEKNTIKNIWKKETNQKLPLVANDFEYFISFTDTNNELPLFPFSGRNLHFSKEETQKIDRFMENYL